MTKQYRFILKDLEGKPFRIASSENLQAFVTCLDGQQALKAISRSDHNQAVIELTVSDGDSEIDVSALVDDYFSSKEKLKLFVKDDSASNDDRKTLVQLWISKEEWKDASGDNWPQIWIYDPRSAQDIEIKLETNSDPKSTLDTYLDWPTIRLQGWTMPGYYLQCEIESVSIRLAHKVEKPPAPDPNPSGVEPPPSPEKVNEVETFQVPADCISWASNASDAPAVAANRALTLTLKKTDLPNFFNCLTVWKEPVCEVRAVIKPPKEFPFRLYEPETSTLKMADLLNEANIWCAEVIANQSFAKRLKVKKHLIAANTSQNVRKLYDFDGASADDIRKQELKLSLSRPWESSSDTQNVELNISGSSNDNSPVIKFVHEGNVEGVGQISYSLCIHLHKKRAVSLAVDMGSYSILAGIKDNEDEGEPILLNFGKAPDLSNKLDEEGILQIYKLADVPPNKRTSVPDRAKFLRGIGDTAIRFALLSNTDAEKLESQGLIHSRIHGFKSRLFAGEKYIDPNHEDGSEAIETMAVFKDVLCQIIAEVLWTQRAKDLLQEVAKRATGEKQEGTSIGLALAHPGHVSLKVYQKMMRAAAEVMTLLHKEQTGKDFQALPQFEHRDVFTRAYHTGPGAVRGISEPVAAAVDQLIPPNTTLSTAEQSAVCLDIGHRTFDFASVRKSEQSLSNKTNVDKQMGLLEVTRFASADLGGQHLTFLLAAALRRRLCELTTDPQIIEEINRAIPVDDADLWRKAQPDGRNEHFTVRARHNRLLDVLERAKCMHNGEKDSPFTIKLLGPSAELDTLPPTLCKLLQRVSQSSDQRFKDFQRSIDEEILFSPTVEVVLATTHAERYSGAVDAFLKDNLTAAGESDIVLAGRGGLSILMQEILGSLGIEVKQPTRTKTKLEVVRGTVLLASNFNALLVDLPIPLIVVWLNNDGKSIVHYDEWSQEPNGKQSTTMQLWPPQGSSSMCVVEATASIMNCLQQSKAENDPAEDQALFDWLTARFFLKEAFNDTSSHLGVVEGGKVYMSMTRPSADISQDAAQGSWIEDEDEMRIGAERISVQATLFDNGGQVCATAHWTFIHPGTINQ